jgi:hypothetical protein
MPTNDYETDDEADVPLPLTLSGLESKSEDDLRSLLSAFAEDISDGRQFDSTEDELATRNWYLQIRTELMRRGVALA